MKEKQVNSFIQLKSATQFKAKISPSAIKLFNSKSILPKSIIQYHWIPKIKLFNSIL